MKNVFTITNGNITLTKTDDGTNRIFLNDSEIDLSEWTNVGTYKVQYNGAVFEVITYTSIGTILNLEVVRFDDDTYEITEASDYGYSENDYTTPEKNKLAGIQGGAEVNQNAFSVVNAGGTNVSAGAKTDTLNVSGSGSVNVIGNASTKTVTISVNEGVANGLATLNANGKVPEGQLPSYVDDIVEYASASNFPATGEQGKIYVALDTGLWYRWSGSAYIDFSEVDIATTSKAGIVKPDGTSIEVANDGTINVNTTFSEASTRANIASGDSITTIWGKIKKFFTDLKTVAFTGSYTDLTNKPTIPSVGGHEILDSSGTSMTQRSKLKFTNATVTDDSTNDTTIVTPTGGGSSASTTPFVDCSTARSSLAKEVTLAGFTLAQGKRIFIRFTDTGTTNPSTGTFTLNVNSTGAITMVDGHANLNGLNQGYGGWFYNNIVSEFVYDGTYWVWLSRDNNTTDARALGHGYGTCSTAAATAAKVATLASYNLINGAAVSIKFTYAVPANATLSINSKAAKNIMYRGARIVAGIIKAGDVATFRYDGTQYHLIAIDTSINGMYTYTLVSSTWASNTDTATKDAFPYKYTITVSRYTNDSTPVWDCVGTASTGIPTTSEKADIALIEEAYFSASNIVIYATGQPTGNVVFRARGM